MSGRIDEGKVKGGREMASDRDIYFFGYFTFLVKIDYFGSTSNRKHVSNCGKDDITRVETWIQARSHSPLTTTTMSITEIHARQVVISPNVLSVLLILAQIFDSRGNPTVEVDLCTAKGKSH